MEKTNFIEIKKSPTADTRSAKTLVDKNTLLESSKQHISDVQKAMKWMQIKIEEQGIKHDWTKIDYIDEFHSNFTSVQKDKSINFCNLEWFKRHITSERHHLTDRCPDDVNLFDVLERIADIVMAGMARTGNIYEDNLSEEILKKAYKNTIELLKKQVKVIE